MFNMINKEELFGEYPYKIELHLHTMPASTCGKVPTEEAMRVFGESGYNAVCFTNHLTKSYVKRHGGGKKYFKFIMAEYENAVKCAQNYGMRVYLCCELRFEKESFNDYLLYGLDEKLLTNAINSVDGTLQNFVENVKDPRTFLVQAHPFRDGMDRVDPNLLDGVEAFNMHFNHNNRPAHARRWADEAKKPVTMGTDFHDPDEHDYCATRFKTLPADSFGVADVLRSGEYIMQVGSSVILP